MLTEDEFRALSTRIVEQCFPEQRKFWAVNKRPVVDQIYQPGAVKPAASERSGDFKFWGELQIIVQGAGETAALISSLLSIYRVFKERTSQQTALENLSAALSQTGMAADQITKIGEIVRDWPSSKG